MSLFSIAAVSDAPGPGISVTDPEGRVTGTDPSSGQTVTQIPNSFTDTEGPAENIEGESIDTSSMQSVDIRQPSAGAYTISLAGTTPQGYTLSVAYFAPNGAVQFQQQISVPSSGTAAEYQVALDPTDTLHTLVQLSNGPTSTPGQLPAGTVGAAYSQAIVASGGDGPLTVSYSVTSGAVPPGLTFAAADGALGITGTPTAAGTVTFSVTAADGFGDTATQSYTLTVNAPSALPRSGPTS